MRKTQQQIAIVVIVAILLLLSNVVLANNGTWIKRKQDQDKNSVNDRKILIKKDSDRFQIAFQRKFTSKVTNQPANDTIVYQVGFKESNLLQLNLFRAKKQVNGEENNPNLGDSLLGFRMIFAKLIIYQEVNGIEGFQPSDISATGDAVVKTINLRNNGINGFSDASYNDTIITGDGQVPTRKLTVTFCRNDKVFCLSVLFTNNTFNNGTFQPDQGKFSVEIDITQINNFTPTSSTRMALLTQFAWKSKKQGKNQDDDDTDDDLKDNTSTNNNALKNNASAVVGNDMEIKAGSTDKVFCNFDRILTAKKQGQADDNNVKIISSGIVKNFEGSSFSDDSSMKRRLVIFSLNKTLDQVDKFYWDPVLGASVNDLSMTPDPETTDGGNGSGALLNLQGLSFNMLIAIMVLISTIILM